MFANHWKTLLCIAIAVSSMQAQYIPFPNSTELDRQPPYLNPSVLDPLFFDNFRGGVRNFNGVDPVQRANAVKFLGNNIYYDPIRKIFINVVTGDYYDPSTGLIYRRVAADRTGFVNGRVGPNPAYTKHAPQHKSDPVDLPKEYKNKVYEDKRDHHDDDEDCDDCARKGQCYRCKKITPKHDCNACWNGKAHKECGKCYDEKMMKNLPYQRMGEYIVALLNKLRKSYDLKDVKFNQNLYETAMIQNLYMANRGYLNNDNFLANVSTFEGGAMTTGYIQEMRLGDQEGAEKFISLWKKSPEQNENLIIPELDQCGAAVFFDQKNMRFIATLICVKL